ncbi:hypothetical protein GCM10011584_18030 [Nocardioides phosphati]|uniref:Type VII secretion integral membrane protein EccD n=1 Tax=Nocardioides phosphati TaxID=1867775 RepID=A0ABQ2N975_9ACTN|nr:EsaB/YukD family protein [Nocardioides phosphati]GGO89201.1 hypothetical protein GCM10011584_18030 [Nocardioides phosphati]
MAGLVRVRVVPEAGAALDLALPGAVPVADLLPELARLARLTFAARLVTAAGRELGVAAGLSEQEVADGAVLALVRADVGDPPVDDPACALAARVTAEVLGWHVRLLRPVALAVAFLLLVVGGAALARGPAWSGAVAASAVVLLAGASGVARRRHDRLLAVAAGWGAAGFAAIAGQQYAGPVAACIAAAGMALVLARALRDVGVLLLPAGGAAVLLGGLALLAGSTGLAAGLVAALGLSAAGLLVPALPRLALAAARDRAGPARELLRALLGAMAVVMVVLAAPTAASGGAGAALAAVVGVLVVCRGSRHHGAVEVATALVTGVVIVLVAAVVTTLVHPGWSGVVGVSCLVCAGAACAAALCGPAVTGGGPRFALAVDRLEAAALVALVPLLVGVGRVVPLVTGLVHR